VLDRVRVCVAFSKRKREARVFINFSEKPKKENEPTAILANTAK
jgi:hypothetical protein